MWLSRDSKIGSLGTRVETVTEAVQVLEYRQ